MLTHTALALLASIAAPASARAQELVPDRALEIELSASAPVLEGHGPSRTFEYVVSFDGTLHVWAASKDFDPILRITGSSGELLAEDDDSGGGTTAYLALAVAPNDVPSITVAAADADASGVLVLHASEAPETELTRAEVERARAELAEIAKLRAAGDLPSARARIAALVERLVTTAGAERSGEIARRAAEAGAEASALGEPLVSVRALRFVLAHRVRTLPEDHFQSAWLRGNLASELYRTGEDEEGFALSEQAVEIFSRTLPEDHRALLLARVGLAGSLLTQGHSERALAILEQVLAIQSRTLAADDPDLHRTKGAFAVALLHLGELERARSIQEQLLAERARSLPEDHPDLQVARENLGVILFELGDIAGARTLFEQVLEFYARTLPADHPDLTRARQNVAVALWMAGDLDRARVLFEEALEIQSRTLPEDHSDVLWTQQNLVVTLKAQGELERACTLAERVVELLARSRPAGDLQLEQARTDLVDSLYQLGEFARARELGETMVEVLSRTRPDDYPGLSAVRQMLATVVAGESALASLDGSTSDPEQEDERRARATALTLDDCRARTRPLRAMVVSTSGREAAERCAALDLKLDAALSFARGYGVYPRSPELELAAFELSETTRGAALVAAATARKAAGHARYQELRASLARASDELAALVQSEEVTAAEFDRARMARETAERELIALAHELSGGARAGPDSDLASLAAALGRGTLAVGLRRYTESRLEAKLGADAGGSVVVNSVSGDRLCAFVVRGAAAEQALTLVDLGPFKPIERAVEAWRSALGTGAIPGRGTSVSLERRAGGDERERAAALRVLVFDPLLPLIGESERIVLALDDVLHLVPFDALPLDSGTLLRDRWRIETRATLSELVDDTAPGAVDGGFLGIGGVSYDGARVQAEAFDPTAPVRGRASVLRGGPFSAGFGALPATLDEVEGIGRFFEQAFGAEATLTLLERDEPDEQRLVERAPGARFLHVATHGWFAPESIRSWDDREPLGDVRGLAAGMSVADRVQGMSPMLLCGLALAGANLPENALGRAPGLITADELSTLDLSSCELAVLSACDTNVGERRAGQGVASLQMALQMAGARSVITSLWKVPDEATKELMLDFYRRLWVEKKPKHQALWEAKTKLREAKDERGELKYTTRDWAAWVLTGDPR